MDAGTPSRDADYLGYLVLNTSPITMQDNQSLTLQSIVPAFIRHVFVLLTYGGRVFISPFHRIVFFVCFMHRKNKNHEDTTFFLTAPAIHLILTNTSCPSSDILAKALFFLFASDKERLRIWRR